MRNSFLKNISIDNERLYVKLALGASFMFVIPVLLTTYLLSSVLPGAPSATHHDYIYIFFLIIVISGLFGYYILRRTISTIYRLAEKAKNIAQGKLDIKLEVPQRDELSDLASSFNKITEDLESKIGELEYSRNLTRELFQKIGHAITSTEKIEALFSLVIQSIRKVFQAEASFIATYEIGTHRLCLRSYSGPQKGLERDMALSDSKGVVGRAINAQGPMVVKTAGDDAVYAISGDKGLIGYQNLLCVPIIEKEEVRGVVGVCNLANVDKIETDDLFLIENIASQIAASIENSELNKNIEETYYQTLVALARAVEARDQYSAKHLERVSEYAEMVAKKLGLDDGTRRVLRGGAILHDLGKIGIRDDILNKEGKLTPDEYEIMKHHSVIGENILKPLPSMAKLAELVRHHHEHYDGSGYPDGLKGEEIPITSRILTLADVYDALSTERPYKREFARDEVIAILKSYAGTILDPKLVELFTEALQERTPGK